MKKTFRKPMRRPLSVQKDCYFCKEKKEPSFADMAVLQRYITERGKIIGQERTGICPQHQRAIASTIKHARHLALIPFLVRD